MTKLSILIPTFGDRAKWIPLSIQAEKSVEPIPGVQVFDWHADHSLAEARNTAAERCSGEWVSILDGDDTHGPGFTAAMLAAVESGTGDIYVPAVQTIEDGRETKPPRCTAHRNPLGGNWCVIGAAIRRSTFFELGGFDDAPLEDWAFWIRAHLAGLRFVDVPEAVYRAHYRGDSRQREAGNHEAWHAMQRRWAPVFVARGMA